MTTKRALCRLLAVSSAALLGILCCPTTAGAVTNDFFNQSQTTNFVAAGATSDTLGSEGYLFTFTRDKLFTGGVGMTNPIGRAVRVAWPAGLEAQAVTAGPTLSGAKFVIARQDGQPFAIGSFTAQLLANTGGAGGAIEVMPMLKGEDGVPNPFMYDASGYYGNHFSYTTPELTGFDSYKITLYVDFALTSLTVVDASAPPPSLALVPMGGSALQLSWPTNATDYTLQCSTNLAATLWNPVTNSVVIVGDLCCVQLEAAGAQRFYRLRK